MSIRVLLADDQIPWDNEEKDGRVRSEIIAEIGEILRQKNKDPAKAYEEDRVWFKDLIRYLEVQRTYDVEKVREYYEVDKWIEDADSFDVIVIDLSWTGDHRLPRGERSDVGLLLIKKIRQKHPNVPIVAFSQNYESRTELMDRVTNLNAFPLQKNYSHVDRQALASAIEFLSRERQFSDIGAPDKQTTVGRTPWDILASVPKKFIPIVFAAVLGAIFLGAYINTEPGDTVFVFGVPLYTKADSALPD